VADNPINEQEKEKGKPGPGSPGKTNLKTAGVVVVVLIIAIIVVMGLVRSPAWNGATQPSVIKNSTLPEKEVSVIQSQNVQNTLLQTGTRTIRQPPTPQKTAVLPVDFVLQSGDATNCGLTCRQLEASITNTGYATAHNVCITVGIHNSRNEIISLNGEPSMNRCIGDISGGQKKTEPITINADCGAFATKCIGETLTMQTLITSAEKTVRFPDQVIAV
jgi:hypothetical protein